MDVAYVERMVEQIRRSAGDDESAHSLEDSLRHGVLDAIASGTAEPSAEALARAVLATTDIDFARWYA